MKHRAFLAVTVVTLFPACSFVTEQDETFHRLVQEAKPEQALCDTYEAATRDAWKRLSEDRNYARREEALEALALLEPRPTVFPKSEAAGTYYLKNYRGLISSWNPLTNLSNNAMLGDLPYHCELFRGLNVLPKLAAAAKEFRFSAADRKRMEAAAKAYLAEGAGEKRMGVVPVMVDIATLERYLSASRNGAANDALLTQVKALGEAAESERRVVVPRDQPAWRQQLDMFTGAALARETAWRLDLGKRYTALFERAFPAAELR